MTFCEYLNSSQKPPIQGKAIHVRELVRILGGTLDRQKEYDYLREEN